MTLLLATPASAGAQYAQPTGITRIVVPSVPRQSLLVSRANAVQDTTGRARKGGNKGAWGAAIGAILGGVYGYKFANGLCERTDSNCGAGPGVVIGGAVIGGILGYLLGDTFNP